VTQTLVVGSFGRVGIVQLGHRLMNKLVSWLGERVVVLVLAARECDETRWMWVIAVLEASWYI
jgi:hypothetical protein